MVLTSNLIFVLLLKYDKMNSVTIIYILTKICILKTKKNFTHTLSYKVVKFLRLFKIDFDGVLENFNL